MQKGKETSGGKPPVSSDRGPGGDASGAMRPLLDKLLGYVDDLGILLLAAVGLLTALALLGWTRGVLTDAWASLISRWLGWGVVLVPLAFFAAGAALAARRQGRPLSVPWPRVIAFEIAVAAGLGLLSLLDGMELPRAEAGEGGGLIGWSLATLLGDVLGAWGRVIALLIVVAGAGAVAFRGLGNAFLTASWLSRLRDGRRPTRRSATPFDREADGTGQAGATRTPEPEAPARKPGERLPREYRKSFKVVAPRLPPWRIFERGDWASVTSAEVNRAAGLIEKTLGEFGLPVKVVDFRTGPAVTRFAVEPGYVEHPTPEGPARRGKVRVSQISALANDLALALSAPTLRIEAPVPGQPYVGIEVPNRRSALVRLRPILESEAFDKVGSPLAIALGRDVAGAAVLADLASMPHLLVAGTTGSGKSVCLTALTACLAANNTPDDLRLVLIDPKMVELVRYNGLPHLFGKVETDLKRIIGVLRWCTMEMDRRYRLLEQAKARDIEVYNQKARRSRSLEHLPRVVVILDELADLMMMAPDQTERTLVRLAQMARATGMHLIVATQRPSTDIVTGLIKANFPARISFAVASGVDSRVILDTPGAETLLGRGDMLFQSPEAAAPVRVQGVYVGDQEIERLVDHWQGEVEAEDAGLTPDAPWEEVLNRQSVSEEQDDVLEQAIELVRRTGQASASMLQRRLRLGYPRAARLMDELEEMGVIGSPQSGGRTREVLLGADEDDGDEADDGGDDEADV
jgi:S-DNA-T family DNA segregation ATPase FtsK/SpoIIIE